MTTYTFTINKSYSVNTCTRSVPESVAKILLLNANYTCAFRRLDSPGYVFVVENFIVCPYCDSAYKIESSERLNVSDNDIKKWLNEGRTEMLNIRTDYLPHEFFCEKCNKLLERDATPYPANLSFDDNTIKISVIIPPGAKDYRSIGYPSKISVEARRLNIEKYSPDLPLCESLVYSTDGTSSFKVTQGQITLINDDILSNSSKSYYIEDSLIASLLARSFSLRDLIHNKTSFFKGVFKEGYATQSQFCICALAMKYPGFNFEFYRNYPQDIVGQSEITHFSAKKIEVSTDNFSTYKKAVEYYKQSPVTKTPLVKEAFKNHQALILYIPEITILQRALRNTNSLATILNSYSVFKLLAFMQKGNPLSMYKALRKAVISDGIKAVTRRLSSARFTLPLIDLKPQTVDGFSFIRLCSNKQYRKLAAKLQNCLREYTSSEMVISVFKEETAVAALSVIENEIIMGTAKNNKPLSTVPCLEETVNKFARINHLKIEYRSDLDLMDREIENLRRECELIGLNFRDYYEYEVSDDY